MKKGITKTSPVRGGIQTKNLFKGLGDKKTSHVALSLNLSFVGEAGCFKQ